jgi:hypothetical protein
MKHIPWPVRAIEIPQSAAGCTRALLALGAERIELEHARDALPLVEVTYRTRVLADITAIDRLSENLCRLRAALRNEEMMMKQARCA